MLIKMREMMRRKDNQKGFTLIELIVVMAILALLLAIAIPRFGNVMYSSKIKAHNANVEMLERAVEMAYANGDITLTTTSTTITTGTLKSKGYLREEPKVPLKIGNVAEGSNYTITAKIDDNNQVEITVSPGKIVQ